MPWYSAITSLGSNGTESALKPYLRGSVPSITTEGRATAWRMEVSAARAARKTLAYDFFRILVSGSTAYRLHLWGQGVKRRQAVLKLCLDDSHRVDAAIIAGEDRRERAGHGHQAVGVLQDLQYELGWIAL